MVVAVWLQGVYSPTKNQLVVVVWFQAEWDHVNGAPEVLKQRTCDLRHSPAKGASGMDVFPRCPGGQSGRGWFVSCEAAPGWPGFTLCPVHQKARAGEPGGRMLRDENCR